jgi:RNA polymerase sigma factor (sigma-70 family)
MAARLSSTLLRAQNDQRLVALASRGSEPAFEALVERYRRPLHSYCRRLLLPAETAEDVVQQAFLSTWQALQRGTEVKDARAWLYRVTHNAALNALRKSGYDHTELDEALHGTAAPEDDLERRIAIRRTLAGLAALPELQREALLRTAVEGRSHEDVARALGLTDGAVRGLVYRARTTLRTAATALTPGPVAQWAASAGAPPDAPLAERVAEIVAGGGTAGAGALLMKGGAALLATGALAGGAVVVEKKALDRTGTDRAEARAGGDAAPVDGAAEPGVFGRAVGRGAPASLGPIGDDDRSGRRDGDGSGSGSGSGDRSGSGSGGTGTSGSSSGPSSSSGASGNSGPGSGSSGSGSSGSGSSGSGGDDDNSGPGSGDDDGDDDNSGPGSGDGDDDGDDNSGSGSSGSDSSGSGSSGSDSGDSSGSGSGDSSGSGSSGSGSGGSYDDRIDSSGSGSGSSGFASESSDSGSGGSDDDESSGSGSD